MTATPSDPNLIGQFERLAGELETRLVAWNGEEWPEDRFDDLARRIFALQFQASAPYQKYCVSRGIKPEVIRSWRAIPPVPTAAFRKVEFRAVRTAGELLFLTSGTTRGLQARGRHVVPFPDLYRASLRNPFRHFVIDDRRTLPLLLSLIPPFSTSGGSSLAWMADDLIDAVGSPGSMSVAGATGIDWNALEAACRDAELAGLPVCLLGTTVAFARWSKRLDQTGLQLSLPSGSVLMDTGGVKGDPNLDRTAMLGRLLPSLGLNPDQVRNEFGMTELLSQMYGRGIEAPVLRGPPWLRTLVVDPVSLEPLPDGTDGILCHFDLANLGSVIGVLTEDRGRAGSAGLVWLGRTPGAPPRGCSLATVELLAAQQDHG